MASTVLLAVLLAWQGCRLGLPGLSPIIVTSATLTLAWNAPPFMLSGSHQVSAYRVYYRVHGTSTWTQLAELPVASGTSYTISHLQVGDGSFDFAVRAVDEIGRISTLHTSADLDASPVGGWYVIWTVAK